MLASSENHIVELQKLENLQDCLKQLQRDLDFFALDFSIEEENYECLFSSMVSLLNYLMEKQLQKLAQLLYRMDLPENQVAQILSLESKGNPAEELAELMIKRAWQKVELRRRYS